VVSTLAFKLVRGRKGHISSVNENVCGLVSKRIPQVTQEKQKGLKQQQQQQQQQ